MKNTTQGAFGTAVVLPSDSRLKEAVVPLKRLDNGVELYRFRYRGDAEVYVGVIAQQVARLVPSAVVRGDDGYLRVDYDRLGLSFMTWTEWKLNEGHARPATSAAERLRMAERA